ncbi:hypothetical protein [Micromonospora sp. NPDC005324]|uniref:hypothetical protein n=1 Tax=Micromonospora sp. NPDC005324 TaxID=3157033 RepID=UPI0033A266A3
MSTNDHRVSGRCCGSSPLGRATPHRAVADLEALDGTPILDVKPVLGAADER